MITLHDDAYSQHLWGVLEAVGGSLWQATPHELVRRDMQTGRIEGRIQLPDGLGSATGGAGSVFVTPRTSTAHTVLTRYDETSGRRLGRLTLNQELVDLEFGNGALWALGKDGTLTKIDPIHFRVEATYEHEDHARSCRSPARRLRVDMRMRDRTGHSVRSANDPDRPHVAPRTARIPVRGG